MATLQAARASALGEDQDTAYSWGLNRAIFYAAAKSGFRGGHTGGGSSSKGLPRKEGESTFKLGDEFAYTKEKDGKELFVMGDKVQTPSDFERQVIARFGGKFQQAWNEALKIVKAEDQENLLSQRKFYEEVYKPRRDLLAKKWTEMTANEISSGKTSTIRKAGIKVKPA